MNLFLPRALAGALLLGSAMSAQATAVLRIACDGDSSDAEITLNGEFKGECPVDVQLPAGGYLLRAVKKADLGRIRDFEQQLRLADGTAKKVTVQLSEPHLTAEGQAQRQRRDAEYVALLAMAQQEKAAAADNEVLMFKRSAAYSRADPADVAEMLRVLALPRSPLRQVAVVGEANVRALVSTDSFFAMPGEDRSVAENYRTASADHSLETAFRLSGVRRGRMFQLNSSRTTKFGVMGVESRAALAGLLPLAQRYQFNRGSATDTLARIDWLEGQPFPLVPGRRFAMQFYVTSDNQSLILNRFVCAVSEASTESESIAAQAGEPVTPLICMTQRIDAIDIQRLYVGASSSYGFHPSSSVSY